MRILHVWDQSGVACTLAKFQHQVLGHETRVMKRDGFDPFEILPFYGWKASRHWFRRTFMRQVLNEAKSYDTVHVHDIYRLIPVLANRDPDQVRILHYHGSRLRDTPQESRREAENLSDLIYVSTPDLLPHISPDNRPSYLPNPVDTDHFAPRPMETNRMLWIPSMTQTALQTREALRNAGIHTKFDMPRRAMMYREMPSMLQKYGTYVDVKLIRGKPNEAYSMTGLQALSVGLDVIRWDGRTVAGLPVEHNPENVVCDIDRDLRKQ